MLPPYRDLAVIVCRRFSVAVIDEVRVAVRVNVSDVGVDAVASEVAACLVGGCFLVILGEERLVVGVADYVPLL